MLHEVHFECNHSHLGMNGLNSFLQVAIGNKTGTGWSFLSQLPNFKVFDAKGLPKF